MDVCRFKDDEDSFRLDSHVMRSIENKAQDAYLITYEYRLIDWCEVDFEQYGSH